MRTWAPSTGGRAVCGVVVDGPPARHLVDKMCRERNTFGLGVVVDVMDARSFALSVSASADRAVRGMCGRGRDGWPCWVACRGRDGGCAR